MIVTPYTAREGSSVKTGNGEQLDFERENQLLKVNSEFKNLQINFI